MRRKRNPTQTDQDSPEWTESTFSRSRPAHEVLPELFGKKAAAEMLRPRGRPKAAKTKQLVSIRLSPEVIKHFRKKGRGWQTRIDETLRKVAGV